MQRHAGTQVVSLPLSALRTLGHHITWRHRLLRKHLTLAHAEMQVRKQDHIHIHGVRASAPTGADIFLDDSRSGRNGNWPFSPPSEISPQDTEDVLDPGERKCHYTCAYRYTYPRACRHAGTQQGPCTYTWRQSFCANRRWRRHGAWAANGDSARPAPQFYSASRYDAFARADTHPHNATLPHPYRSSRDANRVNMRNEACHEKHDPPPPGTKVSAP